MQKLIIFAPNVGGGGGLVLLRELMRSDWQEHKLIAFLDQRAKIALVDHVAEVEVSWFSSSPGGRWRAERALAKTAGPDDLVFCFHNLPPILANRARVFCYVQNANLVGIIPKSTLSGWLRVRYTIERAVAWLFKSRVQRYFVQTPTMATALRSWYGPGVVPVDVFPFLQKGAHPRSTVPVRTSHPHWDFIYVSDGPAHKNHLRLFAAWQLLADRGERPSLAVTLHPERDRHLIDFMDELKARGISIENLGILPHTQVLAAYRQAGALIFPSYAESFGIPLLEAVDAGLPILAPELDYVRDVCEPTITFDPQSERSIARAVLRFLGRPEGPMLIASAQEFADAVCSIAARDQRLGIPETISLQSGNAKWSGKE